MSSRRIGQIFVDMGFMTDEQLQLLLDEQQQQPGAAAPEAQPVFKAGDFL